MPSCPRHPNTTALLVSIVVVLEEAEPLHLPTPQVRAYRVARAHRCEQHQIALLELPAAQSVARGQRDGRARGISILIDVDHHAIAADAQALRRRRDNSPVGLMR